jgi:hypothetical protein
MIIVIIIIIMRIGVARRFEANNQKINLKVTAIIFHISYFLIQITFVEKEVYCKLRE